MNYHIGIDATNIKNGGGLTHLSRVLNALDTSTIGISKITVWAPKILHGYIAKNSQIEVITPPWLMGGLVKQLFGQHFLLNRELKNNDCDLLFCPGGVRPLICSKKTVTMCQNMLPFLFEESRRFGYISRMFFKMLALRIIQKRSFKKSSGVIFLTSYAKNFVSDLIGLDKKVSIVVPHGMEKRFYLTPRFQKKITDYSFEKPFKILYVSVLMPYKMQLEVARAVHALRESGIPLEISFVGSSWSWYGESVKGELSQLDRHHLYLKWFENIDFYKLHEIYHAADGFLFASSCENLPNILLEDMCAGLPIACSDLPAMREVLADGGIYFDPSDEYSIAEAIALLLNDRENRVFLSSEAFRKSQLYSWERCSRETFLFLIDIVKGFNRSGTTSHV